MQKFQPGLQSGVFDFPVPLVFPVAFRTSVVVFFDLGSLLLVLPSCLLLILQIPSLGRPL